MLVTLSIVGSYLKSSRNKSNAHWTKVLFPVNYATCVSLWLCMFLSTQKARRCSIKTPSPGHWLVVGREPRRIGRCVEALQGGAWNHMFLSTATWRCFVLTNLIHWACWWTDCGSVLTWKTSVGTCEIFHRECVRPAIQKVLKDVFVATSTAKEAAQRLQNYPLDDPRLQTKTQDWWWLQNHGVHYGSKDGVVDIIRSRHLFWSLIYFWIVGILLVYLGTTSWSHPTTCPLCPWPLTTSSVHGHSGSWWRGKGVDPTTSSRFWPTDLFQQPFLFPKYCRAFQAASPYFIGSQCLGVINMPGENLPILGWLKGNVRNVRVKDSMNPWGQGCPLCQELIVRLLEMAQWDVDRKSHHRCLVDALERDWDQTLVLKWRKTQWKLSDGEPSLVISTNDNDQRLILKSSKARNAAKPNVNQNVGPTTT